MSHHLLSPRDNRLEDFEVNARGELTQRQMDRLRQVVLPPSLAETNRDDAFAAMRRKPLGRWLLGIVAVAGALASTVNGDPSQRVIAACLAGVLLVMLGVFAVEALPSLVAWNTVRQIRRRRLQADAQFHASLAAPDIQHEAGSPRIQQTSAETTMLYIGLHWFEISADLAETLRDTDERMVAYFLETPQHGNLLLSLQSAGQGERAWLQEVVGISDDGEIIYRKDLEDDIPDGEVRPLKKSSDSGQ